MGKHITRPQMEQYLEGGMAAAEKRDVWAHVQECPICYQRLMEEENLRRDLKQGFSALAVRPAPNFAALLPSILTQADLPENYRPNWTGVFWGVVLTLVMLLPLYSKLDHPVFSTHPNLINVPLPTESQPLQQPPTEDALLSPAVRDMGTPVPMGLDYASPAPPPFATAISSPQAAD